MRVGAGRCGGHVKNVLLEGGRNVSSCASGGVHLDTVDEVAQAENDEEDPIEEFRTITNEDMLKLLDDV